MHIGNQLYFENQKRWGKKPGIDLSLVLSSQEIIKTLMIVRPGFFCVFFKFCNILHIVINVKRKCVGSFIELSDFRLLP